VHIEEVDKPAVPDDGGMVRVHAASVNPALGYVLDGHARGKVVVTV